MDWVREHNLYPDLREVDGPAEPVVNVDGKEVLMFTSNNYLGLSFHPKIVASAIEAVKRYGVGSDGSRLLSGNLKVHREFENAIARFKGGKSAIVWPTGFSANLGAISAIANLLKVKAGDFISLDTVVFSDELNHASIIDGIRMSKQKKVIYKHCDMGDLESKLRSYRFRRKLVVTDSVFSMDGDIAPLDKMVELCKKYNSLLMIDEAHATGVLGNTGHGTLEHFKLKAIDDVDIVLGTCSKALASSGGFVVGNEDLVSYLRVASRTYMFSTAMPPMCSAALITALEVIETEPHLRQNLWRNTTQTREGLKALGFDTFTSQTQIIPVIIGEDEKAIQFSRRLFESGIFAPAVRWPAVPKGKARLRLTLMATHTKEQIDLLLSRCEKIGKELKVIS